MRIVGAMLNSLVSSPCRTQPVRHQPPTTHSPRKAYLCNLVLAFIRKCKAPAWNEANADQNTNRSSFVRHFPFNPPPPSPFERGSAAILVLSIVSHPFPKLRRPALSISTRDEASCIRRVSEMTGQQVLRIRSWWYTKLFGAVHLAGYRRHRSSSKRVVE